jgi:arabinofuranan 3-O-arabinosyltransferase
MQDRADILAGDARLQALRHKGAAIVALVGVSGTLFLAIIVVAVAFIVTADGTVRTLDSDFRVFWAAARILLSGDPLAAFDEARIDAEYGEVTDAWMPWLYPPGYLYFVAPFGLLPYAVAFLTMTLLSLGAMTLATRPFAANVGPVWAAMALAPAYLPALVIGQNSLIWLAVLLTALLALRAGRAVLAGVLIGCLTLKPQLGLLIPLALLAAGQWRTIVAASATTLLLAALPTLFTGVAYWSLLAERLEQQADQLVTLIGELDLTVGPYYVATLLGLPSQLALALQWVITGIAAVSVLIFWRSTRIGFDAKVALLMTAILISAPYLWYYEAALMPAIGMFLFRAGILTTRPHHLALLVLLWIGAGLQSANVFLHVVPDRYLGGVIVTPVLFTAFAVCWVHFLRQRSPAQPSFTG